MDEPKGGAEGDAMARGTEDHEILEALHSEEGMLTLGNVRVVVMTEAAYVFLLRVIHEHAPHVVKYAFYDMGYRAGVDMMGTLQERARDPEGAFRYFVETYRQAGYGDIGVEGFDLSRQEALVRGRNLFEADVARKSGIYRSPRVVDHYSRGMFAGFMSSLLGREVICEETKCQFRGDEQCEFVILPFAGG
jgi:predicted hydrocarbon binding protein